MRFQTEQGLGIVPEAIYTTLRQRICLYHYVLEWGSIYSQEEWHWRLYLTPEVPPSYPASCSQVRKVYRPKNHALGQNPWNRAQPNLSSLRFLSGHSEDKTKWQTDSLGLWVPLGVRTNNSQWSQWTIGPFLCNATVPVGEQPPCLP